MASIELVGVDGVDGIVVPDRLGVLVALGVPVEVAGLTGLVETVELVELVAAGVAAPGFRIQLLPPGPSGLFGSLRGKAPSGTAESAALTGSAKKVSAISE